MIPGIKLDEGAENYHSTSEEKYVKGLDELNLRAAEFYKQGCRFAKWRCIYQINKEKNYPSNLNIDTSAHNLARYARIC